MTILLVEDDRTLSNGIVLSLKDEKTEVLQAFSLAEARELLQRPVDLILLDINLPDGSGLTLCREIRQAGSTPVIFLTANDMEVDIVTGLESGADDYITKPFSLMVLRARVNAILRRQKPEPDTFQQDGFSFDFERMQFSAGGRIAELSKTEQKLLRLLVRNRGNTLSRGMLIDRIWSDGAEFVDENALSVTMRRLREKLPGIPVKTVYGIGYVWEK